MLLFRKMAQLLIRDLYACGQAKNAENHSHALAVSESRQGDDSLQRNVRRFFASVDLATSFGSFFSSFFQRFKHNWADKRRSTSTLLTLSACLADPPTRACKFHAKLFCSLQLTQSLHSNKSAGNISGVSSQSMDRTGNAAAPRQKEHVLSSRSLSA